MASEQMSKMREDDVSLLESPITYGDILGAKEKLGRDTVLPEDAALMQSAEARTFGHTKKDGAASVMQAAAEENVKAGFVKDGDHSQVSEEGVVAQEILIPGAEIDFEYVAGQPVMASVTPTPTDSFLVPSDAVTIGDALEAAAIGGGDRPVDMNDARAIQSAVQRATGGPATAGGLAAYAMSAASLNPRVEAAEKTTLADILMDASIDLDVDKVVTQEDAAKVLDAEIRGSPTGEPSPGGVAAAIQAAADLNESAGLVEPASGDHTRAFPLEDTPAPHPNTPASSPAPEPASSPTPASAAIGEEKETAPAPASAVIGEEKETAPAPASAATGEERETVPAPASSPAPVSAAIGEEKETAPAPAPASAVTGEERKTAPAPASAAIGEEKETVPAPASSPASAATGGEEEPDHVKED